MIERGQIFDYDFGPRTDSRQEGKRPVLVLQTDLLNRVQGYGLTIVVPFTTKGRPSPSHVRCEPSTENGLTATSYAKCEQIFTVPISDLGSPRGRLSREDLFAVTEAVKVVLALG